jgi:hypothetical protein
MRTRQPQIRRSVLLAIRETARLQLDDAARVAIGERLSGETLEIWRCVLPLTAEWYDDLSSVHIVEALHAVLSPAEFVVFVNELCDNGFGRLRKLFLGLATPMMLASRAPDFWAYDHTTGKMTIEPTEGGAIATIADHPYVASTGCRALLTEYFRHAVSLTRVNRVTSSQLPQRGQLQIVIRWAL